MVQYPSAANKCPRKENKQTRMFAPRKQVINSEIESCMGAGYGNQIFCGEGTGGAGSAFEGSGSQETS